MKKSLIMGAIVVIIIIALGMFFISGGEKYSTEEIDRFAKCLTENDVVMYGTFWCPHCAKTKKMFGSSFKHVKYVECDPRGDNEQSILCLEKEIESYDTWEFNDGSRVIGEPSFEELGEKSGCEIPGMEGE
jgi:glutaredoxin